ncbi:thiamine-phosphate diphosphorylase [Methyloceanibacter methanicus]|uniref:Thiamine-phosphate synthase n=1 Tax=Methyloceanibacter methanicus TaxID=1774968 RepID=A0A1E3W185_9HYPH|nr:thiamine phosphate synthase [Methyloceanibacter methanicus]ODR99513.1 thiamine-phosphate diphosphorylase [Methyloceanibacter methanicus]
MPLDPFYPIVPDTRWLARLLPAGIKLVQLRIKDEPSDVVAAEIVKARDLCAKARCQLVVNDYWREAIDAGADFVHLGQEDLASADLGAIRRAKIRIGISTHSEEELETALAAAPDYVALGPIYPTLLKKMPWAPQGLDRIGAWNERIACPLVAIGGITPERAQGVFAAGADSVAVITDILAHDDPVRRTEAWLSCTQSLRER